MIDSAELTFLGSFVDQYQQHCKKYPDSLVLRIAGLYKIKMKPVQDYFDFLVMMNAAPYNDIFCKYDLKGSTNGRRERDDSIQKDTSDSLTRQWDNQGKHMNSFASVELSDVAGTLLDLDFIQDSDEFDRPVEVSLADKEALMEQLFDDIEFFAANRVMDYSLLLCRGTYVGKLPIGVHRLQILASASAEMQQRGLEQERECFYFSFIDISQEFTKKKAMEQFAKVSLLRKDRYAVSSSPPGYYAKRFYERMNLYIKPVLPDDHLMMVRHYLHDWRQYDYYTSCCCT